VKRAAILAVLLTFLGAPSYGQTVGISAGVNWAKITESACQTFDEPCDLDFKTGFTIGVFAPFGWGNGKAFGPGNGKYAIQPEVRFTRKGGKTSPGGEGQINEGREINALEIAGLGRVNVSIHNIRPFVVVGPSMGFTVSAEDDSGSDLKDAFKTVDLQIVFGGGVRITDMLAVETRFQQSIYEIYTDSFRDESGLSDQPFNRHTNRAITFLVDVGFR